MKRRYLVISIISILTLFLGGFQYVKMHKTKSSSEVWVGYNSKSSTDFKRVNVESQSKIDKLEEILLNGKTINKPKGDLQDYDIQLSLKVPANEKSYSFLIWFTNNGAIIKKNILNKFNYISLDNQEAKLVKEIIKYKRN
ncbi:hypothetical protein ACFVRR_23895 [Gottfriedia sp. NPDC057948]|uniref:hypothetical protein n=1 Tax=Gottfriedia sp. NPDC057948 TaxID=3346287 RepID=UPI0036D8FD2B